MKKRSIFSIFTVMVILFSIVGVFAQLGGNSDIANSGEDDKDLEGIDAAYQCLEDEIETKSILSFEDKVFSILALGNKFDLEESLEEDKHSVSECWPKGTCKIKETSQALLALDRINANTNDIEEWLLDRNKTATDLAWYLEVHNENGESASCTVTYNGANYDFQIREDSTLSGSPGSCLSISSSDYLFRIKESCLDEEFDISCDQDFISTLIYQKEGAGAADCLDNTDNACFVSGETHSASSLGTTTEKVSGSCFMAGTKCDYEGTLWAALALSKAGVDVDEFIPYLLALAEDNKRYFPDAFLSILLGDDESYNNVIQQRVSGQFWEIEGSAQNRFYDTSLGMLSLNAGSGKAELSASQDYLLEIQTRNGCWNNDNVRDTAFLLYSGWGKTSVASSSGGSGGGGSALCESAGYFCERGNECTAGGGQILNNFQCTNIGVCCSLQITGPSCQAEGGTKCSVGTQCDGSTFEAGDGSACCLGSCTPSKVSNVCEQQIGGTCKFTCGDGEEVTGDSCGLDTSSICCISTGSGRGNDEGGLGIWIWVFSILIILLVLAIIFRKRIEMWWIKFRSGKGKGNTNQRGRPSAPMGAQARPRPNGMPPQRRMFGMPMGVGNPRPPQGRPNGQIPSNNKGRDSELDDTLKKLRDMSK